MPVLGGYEHCGAIEQYRAATQRLSKLAGVTQPSFRCRKCGKSQVVNGRRQVVRGTSRYGYHYARCVDSLQN